VLVEDEADHLGTDDRRVVTAEHAFDATSRRYLIAEQMLDITDHSVTDQQVGWLGASRREITEFLRERERAAQI
jgi:hypothetical protein